MSGIRNYNQLLPKEVETQPMDTLCIDLIDKYIMTYNKGSKTYGRRDTGVYLQGIIAKYPASGLIEIRSEAKARADLVTK